MKTKSLCYMAVMAGSLCLYQALPLLSAEREDAIVEVSDTLISQHAGIFQTKILFAKDEPRTSVLAVQKIMEMDQE